jgi:hypothetical protein
LELNFNVFILSSMFAWPLRHNFLMIMTDVVHQNPARSLNAMHGFPAGSAPDT